MNNFLKHKFNKMKVKIKTCNWKGEKKEYVYVIHCQNVPKNHKHLSFYFDDLTVGGSLC